MNAIFSPLLLAALCWPLLLAALLVSRRTRAAGRRLAPWAAAPGLAAALLLPDAELEVPGLMLGVHLLLDGPGRVFLAGSALLWLASGWALRARLGERRFGPAWLLALFGSLLLPVAGDPGLFLTAGTVAGYALFALGAGGKGSRAFVVTLVLADLLLFELVLLLARADGGLELSVLGALWAEAEKPGLLLGLLVLGFGTKAGLAGMHFWLAPLLAGVHPGLRPAVIAFTLGAGVLGWLRLWPPGGVGLEWAGGVLQVFGLAAGLYAVAAGMLQGRAESVLAYAGTALAVLWLTALGQQGTVPAAAVVQGGLALAALLCVGGHAGAPSAALTLARRTVAAAAALLLAGAPLSLAGDTVSLLLNAAVGLLVGRGWRLASGRTEEGGDLIMPLLLVGGAMAALAADPGIGAVSRAAFGATLTALILGLVSEVVARRLPRIPPGDALSVIATLSSRVGSLLRDAAETRLAGVRDRVQSVVLTARAGPLWRSLPARVESRLRRWGTAMALFLALGLLAGLLAAG